MKIGTKRRALFVAAIAAASAYGCEERAGDLPILEQAPIAELRALPLAAPTPRDVPLTEAQSVDVLGASSHGEISLARYALGRARQQQTRDLAQMMIDQHTVAQAEVERWAQTASVVAAPNDVTPAIERAVATVRASLESTPDDQFDTAYVRSQVEMHQDALRILDEHVVPGARDARFRALVATIRGGVATHLAHARAVADGLRG